MAKPKNPQPQQTPPPPPPKTESPKSPRATKDPFAIYRNEIINTLIRYDIAEVLKIYDKSGLPSIKELTATYNAYSGNNISVPMMKSWLKELGFRLEVRPVLVNLNPSSAPVIPAKTAIPTPVLEKDVEELFAEEEEGQPSLSEQADEEDTGFSKPPRFAPMEPPVEQVKQPPVNIFRG